MQLRQLVAGFANTNVIYTLVKSGVIEQLRDDSMTVDKLANECGLHADVLNRVLRYATGLGIVSSNADQFSLTEAGRFLLKNVPGSMYGGVMLMGGGPWRKSWDNLVLSLKTGESAFAQTMGTSFFEYLEVNPDHAKMFNDWMTANSAASARMIPDAYDFTPYKTICDIAGGQGLLLKSILLANPHLHGILYDMGKVVEDHILDEVAERVTAVSGDFFKSVPRADILMMKHIIHDWNDDRALQILQNCKKVMDNDTKLLIIERVLDGEADMGSLFLDLHMQVMNGSKERSAAEYEVLLEKAGLKLNRIIPTPSPAKIIEAIR
ncbi:MAG TPA: methyltransferase [Balneolales bacterium]|nr:methyltransferase [Balneolales bacterium]